MFKLKFETFADSSNDIFLRFARISYNENWFYTFNSADIRVRKPFKKRKDVSRENYYPIVGGVFIRASNDNLLQFFPRFPLGAGMLDDGGFELHLHRNPSSENQIGFNSGLHDTRSVEHEFLIKLADLNATNIWKSYLLYKNSPIIFAITNYQGSISLELELEKAYNWNTIWNYQTEYQLIDEFSCIYLSSITVNNNQSYATVLNICEAAQTLKLHGLKVLDERLLNHQPLEMSKKAFEVGKNLKFNLNSNSGEHVVKFPKASASGDIPAFYLKTYEIDYQCKLYHYQSFSDNNYNYR